MLRKNAPILPPRVLRALTFSTLVFCTSALFAAESEFEEEEESTDEILSEEAREDTSRSEARRTSALVEAAPKEEIQEEQAAPRATLTECEGGNCSDLASPTVDLSVAKLHKMKNDLEVVMQPVPGAPQVSVCTTLDAGSRLDPLAAPGAYRVLAEILKEGGYRSTSRDYAALVASRGGVSEVTVSHDATTFCTTVPASELSLALWVSAGRFTSGSLTEESLRAAVDHLARESAEADAQVRTGRANERLRRMAYLGTDSLARPILPNADDLDALTVRTIRELHRESYVARRATVAIVGGFDETALVPMLSEHLFAARPGEARAYVPQQLVRQNTGRFSMAEDRTAKTPAAWYAWVLPGGHERVAAEVALSALLSQKRLGKSLVGGSRAAKSLALYLDESANPAGPALARVEILGSSSQSLGTIEKGFDTQLSELASKGPNEAEIVEIQKSLRAQRAELLTTSLERSRALSWGVRFGATPVQVLAPLDEEAELSPVAAVDVRRAAAEVLSIRKRSAIEIYPQGWQDPWQQPMRKYHLVEAGQTLGSIARQYGTTVANIVKMNSIKQSQTIYPGDKLRVPRGKEKKEKAPRSHQVRRGDTLGGLALKYGVSSYSIATANGMGAKSTIRTGESLIIPWASKDDKGSSGSETNGSDGAQSAGPTSRTHKVNSGETLSGIAHKMGVSTVALAQANGISHKAGVRIGQVLKVPPVGTGKSAASSTSSKDVKPEPTKSYTVKKGDTLSGIAQKNGLTVAQLTVANGISRKSTLREGQTLKIPPKE
jgi:LysM repeat protein/predicted Zn-dependent peptidase